MSNIIIILVSLLLSAFFSGMEMAFISSNKLKIELDKKQGLFSANIISIFTDHPTHYIATMLIGNTFALVTYGVFMARILKPLIFLFTESEISILLIQTLISTLIILLTAEFIPKTLFRINPNKILKFFSGPVIIFYYLFYPITHFTILFSNNFLRFVFKIKITEDETKVSFGKMDLNNLIDENKNVNNEDIEIEHDIKIFKNALDFSNVKLRECIMPRNEIVALDIKDSIEALNQKFINTGYSKILIYNGTIDNIIGYTHSSELFKNPSSIKDMIHKIPIVPETMPANKLLSSFIKNHKSIALVVDEFGGTSGMVTIEDIMEEIFGEIEDEHDSTDLIDTKIDEKEYLFSGRLEIDYINEKYGLRLPQNEDYETVAGLILSKLEEIPKINDNIKIDIYNIKILKVSLTRIELIKLFIENK
ncbi:MAG: HlyC/CorC family transporter [Bacteroidetes bacterium]|nr:HlyC/CorC family transporter [Bacteroidota bacterium]